MARFKNYLLAIVGFAVAGMIGAAFGTGTAQAVSSTLVSVVNSPSSPVPTLSVTDPGRIPYQLEIDVSCNPSTVCVFSFPIVHAGHRVVIQHIIGIITYSPAPTIIVATVESGATNVSNFYVPIPPGFNISQFDWPSLFYVDSSTQASITVQLVPRH